jgi:hypothetical protein
MNLKQSKYTSFVWILFPCFSKHNLKHLPVLSETAKSGTLYASGYAIDVGF